jgi:hypothetical protein
MKMTKKLAVWVLACFLVFSLPAMSGDLEPSGPPAPTMKTLDEVEPRIPISQDDIPLTITQEGSYYLTEDISATATAITVNAHNVTFDLMGYQLSGSEAGYAFYISARKNVEIRNGTIRDFYMGIYEYSSSGANHRIINVRVLSNDNYGIRLSGYGHLIKDCTSAENGNYGISAGYSGTVVGNVVYDNFSGGISASDGCTVIGNTVRNSGTYGIYAGNGTTVSKNTSYGNGSYGIRGGYGSTVTENTCHSNGNNGITVLNGSTVNGNTAYENDGDGIQAYTGSTVISNTAYNNQNYGINLVGNNLVDQNTAYNNLVGNISTCATCTFGVNHGP